MKSSELDAETPTQAYRGGGGRAAGAAVSAAVGAVAARWGGGWRVVGAAAGAVVGVAVGGGWAGGWAAAGVAVGVVVGAAGAAPIGRWLGWYGLGGLGYDLGIGYLYSYASYPVYGYPGYYNRY